MNIEVKKLTPNAQIPTKGTEYSAGYDLYAVEDIVIPENDRRLVGTGIAMSIPAGYVGIIKSRSGISYKFHADVCAGVIDSDYRGEVKVLIATTSKPINIHTGDRIAQILFIPVPEFTITEVPDLNSTVRGSGGFGSTGSS